MASQQPPKKEYAPWQPSQVPPQQIAGGGFKLPQMPSNLNVRFKDAIQNKANGLAGMFVNQGNPTPMAEEAKATQQYGMVAPESKFTPEDLAVLNQVRGNQLPNEKRDTVNALRKNQGAGTALKLGLAGAGLAYVLSGGDMGKVALGGLAGAGAGSLLNRKTALQKLEDYTNMKEANTLNQGYADTMLGQANDEGATVDALAMGGNYTKQQSLYVKKLVAQLQRKDISKKEYDETLALIRKANETPMEYAQIKAQRMALDGKSDNLGKPTVLKGKSGGGAVAKQTSFEGGKPLTGGVKRQTDSQIKALPLGLTGETISKYKKELSDTEEQKRQFNASQKQSAEQASANRGQSQSQFTASEQRLKTQETKQFDYTSLSDQIKTVEEEIKLIPKPPLNATPAQTNAYNARIAIKNKQLNSLKTGKNSLGVNK